MLGSLVQLCHDIFFFAAYVSNGNSFPEPLPVLEERKYLELLEAGDDTARTVLIEHNLRLVAHIAKKYAATNRSTDDMISIGTIGLIKAVSTYKLKKGTALATYAARCIENAILSLRQFRGRRMEFWCLLMKNGTRFAALADTCL